MNTPSADPRLTRIRTMARALDSSLAIPGTSIRFGLDPIIGLIPGFGDLAGAALSGYIVLAGIRLGVSRATVIRMLANVGIDTLVGSIPVVGDLFDAGWKSNNRNVALIERHMERPGSTRASSHLVVGLAVLMLLLLACGGVALTILVVRYMLSALR